MTALEAQVVEDFCGQEGPILKISDSFVTCFYKYKELALQKRLKISKVLRAFLKISYSFVTGF